MAGDEKQKQLDKQDPAADPSGKDDEAESDNAGADVEPRPAKRLKLTVQRQTVTAATGRDRLAATSALTQQPVPGAATLAEGTQRPLGTIIQLSIDERRLLSMIEVDQMTQVQASRYLNLHYKTVGSRYARLTSKIGPAKVEMRQPRTSADLSRVPNLPVPDAATLATATLATATQRPPETLSTLSVDQRHLLSIIEVDHESYETAGERLNTTQHAVYQRYARLISIIGPAKVQLSLKHTFQGAKVQAPASDPARREQEGVRLTELAKVARSHRKRILDEVTLRRDAGEEDVHAPLFSMAPDYSQLNKRTLIDMTQDRFPDRLRTTSVNFDKETLIADLQSSDAIKGIEPIVPLDLASKYHGMRMEDLVSLPEAKDCCSFKGRKATKAELINRILSKNRSAAEELSVEDAKAMVHALMGDFLDSTRFLNAAPVLNPNNATDRLVTTHTRGLLAPAPTLERLEDMVARRIYPDTTDNAGYMCAGRALEAGLHTMRLIQFQEDPNTDEIPDRITMDYFMGLMFTNYDPIAANDPRILPEANLQGVPTPQFAAFLRQRLENFGWQHGSKQYDEEFRQLTTMNNLNITHIQLTLDFLRHSGVIDEEYALGLVTGARNGRPAHVQIVGLNELDVPVIFLYNDAAEDEAAGILGHYDAFTRHGDRMDLVVQWGLHAPGVQGLPPGPAAQDLQHDNETDAQRFRRERKREREVARRRSKKCLPCQDGEHSCNGKAGVPCSNCKQFGTKCTWPDHITPFPEIFHGIANMTEEDHKRWDRPDKEWEEIERRVLEYMHSELPTPKTKHFLVIICMRVSSQADPQRVLQLLARVPAIRQRYNNYLSGPIDNHVPEGQRPGRPMIPDAHMQTYGLVFARHGTRPVPTQLTNNMTQPGLIGFINLLHQVTAQNNQNRPIRIQFVTNGIAGLSVGINGFGDRTCGFFRYMLDTDQANGTDLAYKTDLVTLAEPHVVDGTQPSSLHPGQQSPYWRGHQGKYLFKNQLHRLIDRNAMHLAQAYQNVLHYTNLPTPVSQWGAVQDLRLDAHLDALDEEFAWRANQLLQVPAQLVAARNWNRNGAW